MTTYLYGFSVYHIQEYIFQTNALKEIVGASDIVEGLSEIEIIDCFSDFKTSTILNAAGNVRLQIEVGSNENNNLAALKEVYKNLPKQISLKYPGLKFVQGISELENEDILPATYDTLDANIAAKRNMGPYFNAIAPMGAERSKRTGAMRVPDFDSTVKEGVYPDISNATKYKRRTGKRLSNKLKGLPFTYPLEIKKITQIDSYFAMIHVDANGLGDLVKALPLDKLTSFSKTIAGCTISALQQALKITFEKEYNCAIKEKTTIEIPFRPIIIGGDDITVLIKAEKALQFTEEYLKAFESFTKKKGLKDEKNNLEYLTACAGVTFIKEKFPLHYTANLVEDLCKYAKDHTGRKESALQIHRVRSTFVEDYETLLAQEAIQNNTVLFDVAPIKLNDIGKLRKQLYLLEANDAPTNDLRQYASFVIEGNPQLQKFKAHLDRKHAKNELYQEVFSTTENPKKNLLFELLNLRKIAN